MSSPRALAGALAALAALLLPAAASAAPGDLVAGFADGGRYVHATQERSRDLVVDGQGRTLVLTHRSGDADRLVRLLPSGAPDASFGADGTLALTTTGATRVALQGDHVLVLFDGGSTAKVQRFREDGTIDNGFGTDSVHTISDPGPFWSNHELLVDAKGRVVVAFDMYSRWGAVRLTADGRRDTSFDGDGVRTWEVGQDIGSDSTTGVVVAATADGGFVMGGAAYLPGVSGQRQVLVRLREDGTHDPDFGALGEAHNEDGGKVEGIAVQADGRIVVGTRAAAGATGAYDGVEPYDPSSRPNFVLTRYAADGVVDPTFGKDGDAWVGAGAGTYGGVHGLVAQADGRLVAYGWAARGGDGMALVRFEAGGALDKGFGTDGVAFAGAGGFSRVFGDGGGAQAPDGRLLVSGRSLRPDGVTSSWIERATAFAFDGGSPAAGGGGTGGGTTTTPTTPTAPTTPSAPTTPATPGTPSTPAGPPGLSLGTLRVIPTETVRRMPTVVRLRADAARDRVARAGIRADFDLVEVRRRPSSRYGIGDVVRQSPKAGATLRSSVAEQPRVRLEVYVGPPPSASSRRTCPTGTLAKELRGADADVAEDVLDAQRVRTTVDLRISARADEPEVARITREGRCGAEVDVRAPKRPADNDLFVTLREHPTAMSFGVEDWALTAGERNAYIVQVVDRAGRLVRGAKVLVDNTGVGASPSAENQEKATDRNGEAAFVTTTPRRGTIDLLVTAEGRNDLELWGTAQVRVVDRSRGGACFSTVTGRGYRRGQDGFNAQSTGACAARAARAAAAGGWGFGELLAGVRRLLGLPAEPPVPAPAARTALRSIAAQARTYPAQFAFGQPIGPPTKLVEPTTGEVRVISAGGGNVISAGGGNVISAGGGNAVVASAAGVISAGTGNVISAGTGNVISAGTGNVISAGGGNAIALPSNAAQVISAGGGNVISAGGGNVISAGGGNVISAGGGN